MADNGLTVEQVTNDIDHISAIYDIDWRKLQEINDDILNRIAAFVSLDDKVFTTESLSKLLDLDKTLLINKIKRVSFLEISQNDEIQFTSNSNRLFFAKKLAEYKPMIINENVSYLLKNQDSLEALIGLPKYYSSSSNYDGVLGILTQDYFPKLIKTSQTLTSATISLNLGYVAAKKSGADQKLLDFSLYSSLINNVEGLHVWKSEIEARIEMGDYDNAIKLANSAMLQEDRISLLVRIAKIKKKKKEVIEDSLQEQINHLYKQIDIKNLGDKAIGIAGDLFYVNPSLALNLIEGTSNKANQSMNDWLLSKITLAALESRQAVDSDKMSKLMSDQQARNFSFSLNELFGSYSFEEILSEASRLSGAKEKVLLLRFWIINNKQNLNLGNAINYALDSLIESNSIEFANASLLADIIEEARLVTSDEAKKAIIEKVNKFKDEAKKLSYSVDYFRFMSYAIRARITTERDFAIGWFNDLKKDIDIIKDRVIRAECLSILTNCLYEISPHVAKSHSFLFASLNSQLKSFVSDIYNCSAYHYDNLRVVVWYLAFHDYNFAVEVASKANTTDRRDFLLHRICESYVVHNLTSLSADALTKICNSINDSIVKETCLKILLEEIHSEENLKISDRVLAFIMKNLQQVKSHTIHSYLQCLLVIYLQRDKEKNKSIILAIYKDIELNWASLDSDITKIEIGFQICSLLSETDRDIASDYLKKADDLKKTVWPDSLNTVTIYTQYVRLLIRGFSGLIKQQLFDEKDFSKVTETISAIPSPTIRIELWNYFATISDVKGDLNLRTRIFNDFIKPTFDSLSDETQRNNVLINLAYQFYSHNPIATKQKVESLSKSQREDALMTIINYILYRPIPYEPYDNDDRIFQDKLSFDELVDICELMKLLEIDVNVYTCIESVTRAAIDIKATDVQKQSLYGNLDKIVNMKLPNVNYIQHPGYKIVAQAQLLKLEKDSKKHAPQLDKLVDLADKQVPNISDQAFIYTTLAQVAPDLKGTKQNQVVLISKALSIIDRLDFSFESAYRTEFLLKKLHETNPKQWKERLTKEFQITINSYHNKEAIELQRRLIDHAYRYDQAFAKSLVNLLDDEEVRMEYRRKKHLKNYFESLDLKKQIADDKLTSDKTSNKMFANACNGSLASLNSNKIATKKYSQIRNFLDFSFKLPIIEAYPIYCYYLQNIIRKQEEAIEAESTFRQIVDSIYGVCKFLEVIVQRYKSESELDSKIDLSNARRKLFKAGERDQAFKFIRNWMEINFDSYIKLCDPYFSIKDLDFLKMIIECTTNPEVSILTSADAEGNNSGDLYRKYLDGWKEISNQEPPITRISIVKYKRTGKSPFHDRWLLTNKAGLHIGTSINGIGSSKISQITELLFEEKMVTEKEVFDPLFAGRRAEFNGEKIERQWFDLT